MRKLVLIALAAGAASIPAAAAAQAVHGGGNVVVRHQGGAFMHPGMHPGPNFPHRRLHRGFVVHPFWFGPQFHVQNWQLYGFAPPPRDHRWIRYYDDAYLIDRGGRVMDTRRDLDWDEYGERWAMADGIPSYYGRGDWRPGAEDYAWVERQRGRERHADERDHDDDYDDYDDHADHGGRHYEEDYGYGAPSGGCRPAPGPCGGPAYGGGYGYYGYGWAYPIIIETTVTTGGGCGSCTEVVEEVVEARPRPRRRYRRAAPAPRRYAPPPPPPAGERG